MHPSETTNERVLLSFQRAMRSTITIGIERLEEAIDQDRWQHRRDNTGESLEGHLLQTTVTRHGVQLTETRFQLFDFTFRHYGREHQ